MEYDPEPFDVTEIAEYNIDLFTSNAEQKQITLKNAVTEETLVYADYNMVNTTIRNLVSNALKFTNAGGVIEISAKPNGKVVFLSISDTGAGIPEEDLAKLFRIDVKYTNPGTAGETGTGLGLILCKDLVERNGGEIQVESEIGKGTMFTFTLPKTSSAYENL
jgi:signal transduction histidine kinase